MSERDPMTGELIWPNAKAPTIEERILLVLERIAAALEALVADRKPS